MKKDNLVLVHSFPTNSILLGGLVDYLNDHFVTHFIDLPGFTRSNPPLKQISIEGFSRFAAEHIGRLQLEDYIVGGISFGFMVVNNLPRDAKCKGILGIVPYLGPSSLHMRPAERWFWRTLVRTISRSGMSNLAWKTFMARQYFARIKGYRPEICATIIDQLDARTFFETAALLLTDEVEQRLEQAAYVLLPSKTDRTVDFDRICQAAERGGQRVQVIALDIDHYPQELSRAYFEKAIPATVVDELRQFFATAG